VKAAGGVNNEEFFRGEFGFLSSITFIFRHAFSGVLPTDIQGCARGLVIILLRKIIARPCILAGHDFAKAKSLLAHASWIGGARSVLCA
jgi:hypothetical protein